MVTVKHLSDTLETTTVVAEATDSPPPSEAETLSDTPETSTNGAAMVTEFSPLREGETLSDAAEATDSPREAQLLKWFEASPANVADKDDISCEPE